MKKNIFLIATLALSLVSCEKFLDRYPQGGTMLQDQMESMDVNERREWNTRGLHVKLYTMGGGHDVFGKRSIDLWGDLLSGDVAKTSKAYGWLVSDDQMQTATGRNGTIWSFYYNIIHGANLNLKQDFMIDDASYRHFSTIAEFNNYKPVYAALKAKTNMTDAEREELKNIENYALLFAQTIAIRGYSYAQIAKWFTPVDGCKYMDSKTISTYECAPIYNEYNMDSPQPLSTSEAVYMQAVTDLKLAFFIFDAMGQDFARPAYDKMTFDREVIAGLLAETFLNLSAFDQDAAQKDFCASEAKKYALVVIDSNKYRILPFAELFTTGFNNVEERSWIWGKHTTVENCGGLKSWFGQVDIHSYSYAWAGAHIAIDARLKDEMTTTDYLWDKRVDWFRTSLNRSKAFGHSSKYIDAYAYAPDWKFYSAINPRTETDENYSEDDIDKEWLSDDVFMRIESMYLIAAEACYRLKDYANSEVYLNKITDERYDPTKSLLAASYTAYKSKISSSPADLRKAIIYNWRVELWGEGYGLQTFRRWNMTGRVRGSNHCYNTQSMKFDATDVKFNMNIPSSEATYNPQIDSSKGQDEE